MDGHRLPKYIKPTHYALHICPNIRDFTFDGLVIIDIEIKQDVNKIALHTKELHIASIELNNKEQEYEYNTEKEIVIIKLSDYVQPGKYTLQIKYKGEINDRMEGFYRSYYTDSDNTKKYILSTQFEATSARLALPCFDEPCFKATYSVVIMTEKDNTVLSNGDIEYTEEHDEYKTVHFEKTPIMSSYLLAFVVGKFEYIERYTREINTYGGRIEAKRVRVYGTEMNKHKMEFALDVGVRSLEWYITWFEIDYPLRKLDMIGIPEFSAGAMENWGLVTYRDGLIYCDENTELDDKQDIVVTICHELAHQWFGNLVTMEWWSYLWLNESMATYFGWHVTDILFPEWNIWDKFNDNEYSSALELDSLESSHPIEVSIERTEDIANIFDAISYSKGSCIVKFMVKYMGDETFRAGMRYYMMENAYKNTESVDLWKAFDYINKNSNISELMISWTKQTGYPVLILNNRDNTVSQERFFKNGRKQSDTLWKVPLDADTIMTQNIIKYYGDKLNTTRDAFYRVIYSDIAGLTLTEREMANILDDATALAFSGYHSFSKIHDILGVINKNTMNYPLWEIITKYIYLMDNYTQDMNVNNKIMQLVKEYTVYINLIFDRLGWQGSENTEMRNICITFLGEYGNKKTINEAIELFRKGSLKKSVLSIAGKYGDNSDYDKLMELLLDSSTSVQTHEAAMYGLAAVSNINLIERSIKLIFSGLIKSQDLWIYVRMLMANKNAREKVRKYMYTEWNKIRDIYKSNSSEMLSMIKTMGLCINNNEEYKKYKMFFGNTHPGAENAYSQTIEKIESRLKTRHIIEIDEYFA